MTISLRSHFFSTFQVDFIGNKQKFYQEGLSIGREPEERRHWEIVRSRFNLGTEVRAVVINQRLLISNFDFKSF